MKISINILKTLLFVVFIIPISLYASTLSELPQKERTSYFFQAEQAGITGVAIKTKPVLARPAKIGEIITTVIQGEGIETTSEPASEGDWVVQNICPKTGNEEILVKGNKFLQRYAHIDPNTLDNNKIKIDDNRYQAFIPKGIEMNYFIIPSSTPVFAMKAPWGELQRFQPGDAVVQSTTDKQDIYRIQKDAFKCTYHIVKPAKLQG